MKLSLRSLFGLVAVVAISIGSLLNANQLWFQVLSSSTVVILAVGTLAAIGRTGTTRYFWIGFVLIGVAYMVAAFSSGTHTRYWFTESLLDYLHPHISTTIAANNVQEILERVVGPHSGVSAERVKGAYTYLVPARGHFVRVGHLLFTLIFAFLGGIIARYFFVTRDTSAT